MRYRVTIVYHVKKGTNKIARRDAKFSSSILPTRPFRIKFFHQNGKGIVRAKRNGISAFGIKSIMGTIARGTEERGGGRRGWGWEGRRERGKKGQKGKRDMKYGYGNADICQEIDNSNKLVAKRSNSLPNGTILPLLPAANRTSTYVGSLF